MFEVASSTLAVPHHLRAAWRARRQPAATTTWDGTRRCLGPGGAKGPAPWREPGA